MVFFGAASAASLDGTSSVKYQTNPYVFRDGDTARGIVCFGKGFTVVPATNHGSNLFLDTNISISGGIDLRGTSTMTLLHDVMLDSNVTFSDSGRIYSYGSSLIMGGDLTIPANKVLHCGGNLIIDGKGHTLTLGSGAQLFLDNAATLTLRNMVVKTTHQYPGAPALTLSSTFSKLALDNVMLALSDDFYVNRGQLFIHNDVMVTGTSALVYRSTSPSFIASQGCLAFDSGTTFSFAPSTDKNDLILMADASSSLVLDGCSLKTTHTGLRLTKGRLYMDNKVALDSSAVKKLNAITPAVSVNLGYPGTTINAAVWSPNGQYLAVGAEQSFEIYSFNGSTLTCLAEQYCGNRADSLAWSPNGNYLAVGVYAGYVFGTQASDSELQVYSFNGSTLTAVASQAYGNSVYSLAWSPDGNYLAIGGTQPSTFGGVGNSNELQVYSFNGTTLTAVTSQRYGDMIRSVAWSPDGNYLAVGGQNPSMFGGVANTNELQVYSFNGSTLTVITSQDYGSDVRSVAWSPDGLYLAVGGSAPSKFGGVANTNELQIYSFDGSTLTAVTSQDYGSGVYSVAWSPDGLSLAVGGISPSTFGGVANTNELQIYSFNGSVLTAVTSQDYGYQISSVAWSPNGQYLALGGMNASKFGGVASRDELQVYSFNGSVLAAVTSQDYGVEFSCLAWSSDGQYLVVGGADVVNDPGSGQDLRVYRWNGSTLTAVTAQDFGIYGIYSLAWSPDGKYLAVGGLEPSQFGGGASTHELQIYSFNGSTLSAVTSQDYGSRVYSVAWSPDGRYVAVGGQDPTRFGGVANNDQLQVYRFDGRVLIAVTSQVYGSSVNSVAWSPDGKYLAIGGNNASTFGGVADSNCLQIYRFNGLSLAAVVSYNSGGLYSVEWSPDGQFLAYTGLYLGLSIVRFNGASLGLVASQVYGYSARVVSWSADGRYVAIGGGDATSFGGVASINELQVYSFNRTTLTPITSHDFTASPLSGGGILAMAWASDGSFLAYGGNKQHNGYELVLDRCDYINETSPQDITKGIVWGNSAAGDAYDLDIHVLSGARVEVSGKLFHDPA